VRLFSRISEGRLALGLRQAGTLSFSCVVNLWVFMARLSGLAQLSAEGRANWFESLAVESLVDGFAVDGVEVRSK